MTASPDPDILELLFTLPADARLLPLSEFSPRIRASLGCTGSGEGQVAVSRPGFRVTTRLVSPHLAALLQEFRQPSRLADAVLRFSRANSRDPLQTLDDAFDALCVFIDCSVLVPSDSESAKAIAPSLAAGQAVAGYELVRLVSSLADTEVYQAQTPAREPVALKIARPDAPAAVASCLVHEAELLQHLGGGYSPSLVELGEFHHRTFVAMEWRHGNAVTVAAQQARSSLDRRWQHQLCSKLLSAYGWLHQRGVVHGDIHPGNIVVGEDGAITILDFGRSHLAAPCNVAGPTPQSAGIEPLRAGVPFFYEPEIAGALLSGALPPRATFRAEQYSVAALVHYLLTGLHYADLSPEQHQLLAQVVGCPMLPFAARGLPGWPRLEAVLATALAKDPASRFESMAAFGAAFEAAGREDLEPQAYRRARPTAGLRLLDDCLRRANLGWEGGDDDGATATVGAGAFRLAWFSLRASLVRDDPCLLASAEVWASLAKTPRTPAWSVEAVLAEIHHSRGDPTAQQRSIAAFLSACRRIDRLDLAGARSGALTAAAGLLKSAAAAEIDCRPLTRWMRHTVKDVWRTAAGLTNVAGCQQLVNPGTENDWTRPLHATAQACRAMAVPPPAGWTSLIEQMAELGRSSGRRARTKAGSGRRARLPAPGWSSASHVLMWAAAYEQTGDARFRALAERAGRHAAEHAVRDADFCRGTTGRGFAHLRLYQVTGETSWLDAARRLADAACARWHRRPVPSDDGALGTALLLLELEAPERAVMPAFGLAG
jgi:hypothetical protein